MRLIKKVCASALAACLAVGVGATPALATEVTLSDAYGYQIMLYPGEGTIGGSSEAVTLTPIDGSVTIDYANAVPDDDRYYVRGVRKAGLDNSTVYVTTNQALTLPATADAQYVVAYGMKKNQVSYTVEFIDAAGNTIAPSETLYGNPGDKPVVAFRYIDGYLPSAYNLTKTLSGNAADNVFTFTYNAAPEVTYTVIDDGVTTVTVPAAPGAPAAPAGAAAVADAAAAGEVIGDDGTPLAAPEEIVDLDDDEVPLAAGPSTVEDAADVPVWAYVIGGVVGALIIALIAAAVIRSRKKDPTHA